MAAQPAIDTIGHAIGATGPLPAMGPTTLILRSLGFRKGQAPVAGVFKLYATCLKGPLFSEARARGLDTSGTAAQLKARLLRSDQNALEAGDWGSLPTGWDVDCLDAAGMVVSTKSYEQVKVALDELGVLPAGLPAELTGAAPVINYTLWMMRQFLAFSHANHAGSHDTL